MQRNAFYLYASE